MITYKACGFTFKDREERGCVAKSEQFHMRMNISYE